MEHPLSVMLWTLKIFYKYGPEIPELKSYCDIDYAGDSETCNWPCIDAG